ncbi:hypothetical protein SAMN04244579_02723 [Azotobacter beijerinckii]|uniref:Cyanophage baseplate Pam3 plug gp18 domain-containing protein n=1 Tax=Azotobacter beijerinckii TaxID=170623 RepID=A0A1H6V3B6_9GAMM|nr:hypothetical protein [Azotobacter beijerinckii]SEI99058.1 hypothetical protein SAMN04244579_02723 [Azotobacter beijerinckii]
MGNYEIPLTPEGQRFSITLGGTEYQLRVQWRNAVDAGWTLDIADAGGNAIVSGIPLVTGCNLLDPYPHLGFSGVLWVQTTADPDAAPDFGNLGSASHLYWWTE